jgi:hypothetical protein
VVGQAGFAAEIEEQPVRDVALDLPHEFAVGPAMKDAEIIELEHLDGIQCRPPFAGRVVLREDGPKAFEVDRLFEPP